MHLSNDLRRSQWLRYHLASQLRHRDEQMRLARHDKAERGIDHSSRLRPVRAASQCTMPSTWRSTGGFTLEVQHVGKDLGGGSEVKAFARRIVVGGDHATEASGWEAIQVGLAGHEAPHPADGVFDAALLPGGVRIAEEGLDGEAVQGQMTGELGAVVEGHGLPQALWQGSEQAGEMAGDANGNLAGETDAKQDTRGALVHGQDRLAVFGEHHEVGLPVARDAAIVDMEGPFCQRNTAFDEACGAAASLATDAALALAARQVAPPSEVIGAPDLGIDEAVDGLVGDHFAAALAGEPACDLFGRPALAKAFQNRAPQVVLPCEAYARPAPRFHLLLGIGRFIADLGTSIALQLPRDR